MLREWSSGHTGKHTHPQHARCATRTCPSGHTGAHMLRRAEMLTRPKHDPIGWCAQVAAAHPAGRHAWAGTPLPNKKGCVPEEYPAQSAEGIAKCQAFWDEEFHALDARAGLTWYSDRKHTGELRSWASRRLA